MNRIHKLQVKIASAFTDPATFLFLDATTFSAVAFPIMILATPFWGYFFVIAVAAGIIGAVIVNKLVMRWVISFIKENEDEIDFYPLPPGGGAFM